MDLDEQLKLGHLLLEERTCRVCGERKNLLQSFYRVHKNVKLLSSYSYSSFYLQLHFLVVNFNLIMQILFFKNTENLRAFMIKPRH